MHRVKRLILSVLCIAVVLSGTTVSATANNLPAGFLIGDHDGISVTRDGEYFINAVELEPGDVITKTLTIRNTEEGTPFKLTMTAEPLQTTGPVDLLDVVHLELKLDGKVVYDGRIRGDEGVNMIQNALNLGQYAYGDSKVMNIVLTVSEDMKPSKEKSTADIGWRFYAVRDEAADPPKTGETIQLVIYFLMIGMMLIASFLLIYKKKHEDK